MSHFYNLKKNSKINQDEYFKFFNFLILERGMKKETEKHRFVVPLMYAFIG